MIQLKRILFPVDFSPRSRGAAVYVEALAGRFDAEVLLLHVIEPAPYNRTLAEEPAVTPESIRHFFGPDLEYIRTEVALEHGEAALAIVKRAVDWKADLIMMPTQGLGVYRRLIIGSNVAKVLHDADCPVWTGTHLQEAPQLEQVHTERILCAVDLERPTEPIVAWASEVAAEYQAQLTLVYVSSDPRALQGLDAVRRRAGLSAEILVKEGDPAKTVAETARETRADLLVIGRRAEIGLRGRLEMTSYSIIRQSPCPVLSV